MDVVSMLTISGALPVAELVIRSPLTPEDLLDEIRSLKSEGIVELTGELPESLDAVMNTETKVRLTRSGVAKSFV